MKEKIVSLIAWILPGDNRPVNTDESRGALARAHVAKAESESRWAEVRETAQRSASIRQRNHFIEGFKKTL